MPITKMHEDLCVLITTLFHKKIPHQSKSMTCKLTDWLRYYRIVSIQFKLFTYLKNDKD